MTGWLIAILAALGALGLGVVKADLEDAAVCRWLARQLIFRAAQRLPRGERTRWREESIRDVLDLPGRLPPLLWALDIYMRSGSWGRLRGGPTRLQGLIAWTRAALVRLRSWPAARARSRSKQRHPAYNRTLVEATEVVATATVEATAVIRPAGIPSREAFGVPTLFVGHGSRPDGRADLSDADFLAWLSQQRRDFEDDLERRTKAWRQAQPGRQLELWRQRGA